MGVFYSCVLRKPFVFGIPMSFFLIVALMYPFSIMNMLEIGLYTCILIIIAIYAISGYYFYKSHEKKQILTEFISTGCIIFYTSFFILFLLVRNNVIMHYDELRLWGAYPKIMFYKKLLPQFTGDLFYFPGVASQMDSYPPGIMLVQYLFLSFNKVFEDYILFFGYYIFYCSLLAVAFERMKRTITSIIIGIVVIFVFIIVYYQFMDSDVISYMTLYIDPLLGVLFGYTLVIIAFRNEIGKSWLIQLIFANITLVLLKQYGIILAGLSCAFYLVDLFFVTTKNEDNRKLKFKLLEAVICCVIPLVIFASWNIFLSSRNLVFGSEYFSNSSFFNNITHFPAYTADVTKNYFLLLLLTPCFGNYFSSFAYLGLLILISILLFKITKNKKILWHNFTAVVCALLYFVFLWYCYIFVFSIYEATILVSATRYIRTILIGIGVYYLAELVRFYSLKIDKKLAFDVLNAVLTVSISISLLLSHYYVLIDFIKGNGTTTNLTYDYGYQENADIVKKDLPLILAKVPAGESLHVFYSPGGCNLELGRAHHIIYYELLDYNIIVNNTTGAFSIDCLSMEQIDEALVLTDFLFLSSPVTKEFNEQFNEYFKTEIELKSKTVYYVFHPMIGVDLIIYPSQ
jgi:hypothetical protein